MSSNSIRILHTADWHIGKQLHGADLGTSHRFFFDWLEETIDNREVDLVLVSGDLFDRLNPSSDSENLFIGVLERLRALAQLVLITGNHDPSGRLSYGGLLESGIELRSGVRRLGEPHLISDLAFPLVVYPIPYLYPYSAARDEVLDCEPTHEAVLETAFDRARENLSELREEHPNLRSLAMAHAFVRGGATSDSERPMTVGGAQEVSPGLFEGFDYVALGHLHKPQAIAPNVRYSGSPIPLSFSEVAEPGAAVDLKKTVPLIELRSDGLASVEEIEVDQAHRLRRIQGELDEILGSPPNASDTEDRVEIRLMDERVPPDAWARLKKRFPHLLSLPIGRASEESEGEVPHAAVTIDQRSTEQLIEDFLIAIRGRSLDSDRGASDTSSLVDDEERELIREAVESTRSREVEG